MSAFLHSVLAWTGVQAKAMGSVVAAVAGNHPAPAGQVAIHLLALAVLLVFVPKIIKKFT